MNVGEMDVENPLTNDQYEYADDSYLPCSNNLSHAENLLHALKSAPRPPDGELAFQISTSEIDYHMRIRNHDVAYNKLEHLLGESETDASINLSTTHDTDSTPTKGNQATSTANAIPSTTTNTGAPYSPNPPTLPPPISDTHQMIRLLTLKCCLLSRCGRPQKSLTIALRAVAAAYTSRIMPGLWEAVEALADALNGIGEHDASVRCVEGVVEGAVEGGDFRVVGGLWMMGADALVGLAGKKVGDERCEVLRRAVQWLEKAGTGELVVSPIESSTFLGCCCLGALIATLTRRLCPASIRENRRFRGAEGLPGEALQDLHVASEG